MYFIYKDKTLITYHTKLGTYVSPQARAHRYKCAEIRRNKKRVPGSFTILIVRAE